jgi:hypothetical protein
MAKQDLNDLLALLDHSVSIEDGKVTIKDAARLRATIHPPGAGTLPGAPDRR